MSTATLHSPQFDRAIAAFDALNAEDPNSTFIEGQPRPKELVYAERMSEMLARYTPDASEALQLASRCQHIQRWKIERSSFPMTKGGYHRWRNRLKDFHAEIAARVLQEAGYQDALIAQVTSLVRKELPLTEPDMQTLEDVIVLVFIEHYLQDFVDAHAEYDADKLADILRKTLRKTSARGRQAALTMIALPPALVPVIEAVMHQEGWLP